MALYEFFCLACSRPFEVESCEPPEDMQLRCPHCGVVHNRQTWESRLRNAASASSGARLEAMRGEHFG